MMPKRQQKRKFDQKHAVNVAKTATFTGPGTIELNCFGLKKICVSTIYGGVCIILSIHLMRGRNFTSLTGMKMLKMLRIEKIRKKIY